MKRFNLYTIIEAEERRKEQVLKKLEKQGMRIMNDINKFDEIIRSSIYGQIPSELRGTPREEEKNIRV